MRCHIDTIPVWDAFRGGAACPLCFYRVKTEALLVERALGASVMEPESRIKANQKGFCALHQGMLYRLENRLGHALLLQSHLAEIEKKVRALFDAEEKKPRPSLFAKKRGEESAFDSLQNSCLLCEQLGDSMQRFTYALLHLYQTDAAFRTLYQDARGLCLKDVGPLLSMARAEMKGDAYAPFFAATRALALRALDRSRDDIDFFTRKFDYRNADLPWGDKRDAVERAANFLRGACVGTALRPDSKDGKKT